MEDEVDGPRTGYTSFECDEAAFCIPALLAEGIS